MTLGQFTEPKLLIPRLLSDQQDGAIQELSKRLAATGRIGNAPAFLAAVLKREAELPTFIDGVAVPHVRGAAVTVLSVAIGLSAHGIPWGGHKDRIAYAVILFAVPLTEAQTYLQLLSGRCALIQDDTAFARLKAAVQPEEMFRMLKAVRVERPGPLTANASGTPTGGGNHLT